jgi:hypothetical protein
MAAFRLAGKIPGLREAADAALERRVRGCWFAMATPNT